MLWHLQAFAAFSASDSSILNLIGKTWRRISNLKQQINANFTIKIING